MNRKCLSCGVEFDGTSDSTLCQACAADAKTANVVKQRVCQGCGIAFDGGPRAWYCPTCRAERKRQQKQEYVQRQRAGTVRHIGSIDLCVICGKPYIVGGSLQRYCPDCAPAAVSKNDRRKSREWNDKFLDHADKAARRKAAAVPAKCIVCGRDVAASSKKTCSTECAAIFKQQYNESVRLKRNAYHLQKKKEKEAAMTDEEYAEYRKKVNAQARINYRKRKEKS